MKVSILSVYSLKNFSYDEAFPPLGDCSFPLVIETNWTDAAADGSNEEEEGRNTTNLLDRGTTRLDSITPAHTNALVIHLLAMWKLCLSQEVQATYVRF